MSSDIQMDVLKLKLDLDEPSEMAKTKAFEELRETPDNIRNGLKELKTLLQAERELNIPKTNDEWLMKYLRVCKFYPESARDLIIRYYKLRRKYKEITNILLPNKLKYVFEANLVTILPQRDQHGCRMLLTLGGKPWDYKTIQRDPAYASATICTDMLQIEPETQINGIVYILDLEGLTFFQAFEYNPYVVKRFLDYIQGNIPLRVKGFHIVNQPSIFQSIFTAAKPFFNTKYANRIHLHGRNYKSLHEYISPECLPSCYGGNLTTKLMYAKETYELLTCYQKYFETLLGYGSKIK